MTRHLSLAETPVPEAAQKSARPAAPKIRVYIAQGRVVLDPEKNFYRVEEAADVFSVSPRTIERWVDAGRLTAFRPGAHRLVTAESVVALLVRGYFHANGELPG